MTSTPTYLDVTLLVDVGKTITSDRLSMLNNYISTFINTVNTYSTNVAYALVTFTARLFSFFFYNFSFYFLFRTFLALGDPKKINVKKVNGVRKYKIFNCNSIKVKSYTVYHGKCPRNNNNNKIIKSCQQIPCKYTIYTLS